MVSTPPLDIKTPKRGRRFCRLCGCRIASGAEAVQVRVTKGWSYSGKTLFWLCERDGERVAQAMDAMAVPYLSKPDQRRVGVRERRQAVGL